VVVATEGASVPASARRIAGALALVVLAVALVPLAAPGDAFVPGTDAGTPGWLLGIYGHGLGLDRSAYLAWLWVAFAAYLLVVACAGALGKRVVAGAAVAAVVAFVLAPPLHSLDVFSYLSYARLEILHGLNPYDFAPSAIPHDAAAMRVQDFRDATTVYGPLFTVGSYPLGLIGVPAALWVMKAIAGAAVLGIGHLAGLVAERRGIAAPPAVALVVLNPLVLVHVVGGPHNDALMMLAAMTGVYLLLDGRVARGALGVVAGIAMKAAAAFVLPFALLGTVDRRRAVVATLVGAAFVGAVALAVFGTSFTGGVLAGPGSQTHTSYHSVPALINRATGLDIGVAKAALLALYAALVLWLLRWVAQGGDWIRAAGWAAAGLLVASAYVTPWYVLWPLPLAAVARDRALIALTLALCAYQLSAALPS
jgi:alpha-1,6-mannosyltransferase